MWMHTAKPVLIKSQFFVFLFFFFVDFLKIPSKSTVINTSNAKEFVRFIDIITWKSERSNKVDAER
jgi:hypothetical protein